MRTIKKAIDAYQLYIQFQEGDLVMVHLRPERFHPSTYQKLQAKKIGLLWVLKQLGENAYLLELPSKLHFNPMFNVEDLDLQLPPSLSLHLEIEHILDDQRVSTQQGGYQIFFVKRQGKPHFENT